MRAIPDPLDPRGLGGWGGQAALRLCAPSAPSAPKEGSGGRRGRGTRIWSARGNGLRWVPAWDSGGVSSTRAAVRCCCEDPGSHAVPCCALSSGGVCTGAGAVQACAVLCRVPCTSAVLTAHVRGHPSACLPYRGVRFPGGVRPAQRLFLLRNTCLPATCLPVPLQLPLSFHHCLCVHAGTDMHAPAPLLCPPTAQ